jgi:hypothetical protein
MAANRGGRVMTGLRHWACGLAILATGCASAPPLENPALIRPYAADSENPILVAPGAPSANSYAEIYEVILDVLDDYFEIKPTSRYAGHIETFPVTSPGMIQFWKPGSPDPRERLIATVQSMRHFAIVDIWAGERGGYRVYVEVHTELEDAPRPLQAVAGPAVFRNLPNVDRTAEVVGADTSASMLWIPKGRDYAFEQLLLRKIRDRAMKY